MSIRLVDQVVMTTDDLTKLEPGHYFYVTGDIHDLAIHLEAASIGEYIGTYLKFYMEKPVFHIWLSPEAVEDMHTEAIHIEMENSEQTGPIQVPMIFIYLLESGLTDEEQHDRLSELGYTHPD